MGREVPPALGTWVSNQRTDPTSPPCRLRRAVSAAPLPPHRVSAVVGGRSREEGWEGLERRQCLAKEGATGGHGAGRSRGLEHACLAPARVSSRLLLPCAPKKMHRSNMGDGEEEGGTGPIECGRRPGMEQHEKPTPPSAPSSPGTYRPHLGRTKMSKNLKRVDSSRLCGSGGARRSGRATRPATSRR